MALKEEIFNVEIDTNITQPTDDNIAMSEKSYPQRRRSASVRFTIRLLIRTRSDDEPTLREALKWDNAEKWNDAMDVELRTLQEMYC